MTDEAAGPDAGEPGPQAIGAQLRADLRLDELSWLQADLGEAGNVDRGPMSGD